MGFIHRYLVRKSKLFRLIESWGVERSAKAVAYLVLNTLVNSRGYAAQTQVLHFLRQEFDAAYEARQAGKSSEVLDSFLVGVDTFRYLGARDDETENTVHGSRDYIRRLLSPLLNDGDEGISLCTVMMCEAVTYIRKLYEIGIFLPKEVPNRSHYIDIKDCFGCAKRDDLIEIKIHELKQISLDVAIFLNAYNASI